MPTATPVLKVPAATEITPDGTPVQAPVVPQTPTPPVEPSKSTETPTQPTATPPKSIADLPKVGDDKSKVPDLDFTDFLKVKGEEPPKAEEPVKKPDESVKKDELPKIVPPIKQTEDDKQKQVTRKDLVEQDKKTRDVADITDASLSSLLVDEMSRAAFDRVKPIISEHTKLKTELAELKKDPLHSSYYEHPQSFVLTPEFQESLVEFQEQQRFLNTLKQQEMAVIEGKDSFMYPVFNQLTNQYEMKQFQNNAQNAAQLRNNIAQLEQTVVNSHAKMKVIEQTHLSKVQQSASSLAQKEQAWFGRLDTPENKPIFDPMIKAVLSEFPAMYHNSPLMSLLAKSLVLNQTLKNMLDKANGAQVQNPQSGVVTPGTQPTIQRPQLQPTQGEVSGAIAITPGQNGNEVTMDDFAAVKQGR